MEIAELLDKYQKIECSHTIREGCATWPEEKPLFCRQMCKTIENDGFQVEVFTLPEDYGTHMDSPRHFYADGRTISDIPADELFVPGVVIDIWEASSEDPDYEATVDDLLKHEQTYGAVPDRALVCLRTGWSRQFPNESAYRNNMHFPGFSTELAKVLVEMRGVVGIGIDTLSPDRGISTDFGVHQTILSAGCYIIENMVLEQINGN